MYMVLLRFEFSVQTLRMISYAHVTECNRTPIIFRFVNMEYLRTRTYDSHFTI